MPDMMRVLEHAPMDPDASAVDCYGELIVATRGPDGPGEALVRMRGGTEPYLEPLPKGTTVPVFNSRIARMVDVMEWVEPLEGASGGGA